MGEISAKPKTSSGAILRRRRGAVAAFRRDRRSDVSVDVSIELDVESKVRVHDRVNADDVRRAVPRWGRIVFRSGATTLR